MNSHLIQIDLNVTFTDPSADCSERIFHVFITYFQTSFFYSFPKFLLYAVFHTTFDFLQLGKFLKPSQQLAQLITFIPYLKKSKYAEMLDDQNQETDSQRSRWNLSSKTHSVIIYQVQTQKTTTKMVFGYLILVIRDLFHILLRFLFSSNAMKVLSVCMQSLYHLAAHSYSCDVKRLSITVRINWFCSHFWKPNFPVVYV